MEGPSPAAASLRDRIRQYGENNILGEFTDPSHLPVYSSYHTLLHLVSSDDEDGQEDEEEQAARVPRPEGDPGEPPGAEIDLNTVLQNLDVVNLDWDLLELVDPPQGDIMVHVPGYMDHPVPVQDLAEYEFPDSPVTSESSISTPTTLNTDNDPPADDLEALIIGDRIRGGRSSNTLVGISVSSNIGTCNRRRKC